MCRNHSFLFIYHPVTTDYGLEGSRIQQLLFALNELRHPTLWLWPNIDAGSNDISKVIRSYREASNNNWLHLVKNLEPEVFQKCLKKTVCAIGNSSSFIRDTTFTGTPVVLIGNRQVGREYGENVVNCEPEQAHILAAVRKQVDHGQYAPSNLYGSGDVSRRIVHTLLTFQPTQQKHLDYIYRDKE